MKLRASRSRTVPAECENHRRDCSSGPALVKIPADGAATVDFIRLFVLSGSRTWAGADRKIQSNQRNAHRPTAVLLSRRLLVVSRFHSQPAFHPPNPRSGTPGREFKSLPPHGVAFARQTRAQGGSIDRPVASYGLRAAIPKPAFDICWVAPFSRPIFVPVPTWCRHHFRRSRALGHNFLKRLAGGLGFEPRLAESEVRCPTVRRSPIRRRGGDITAGSDWVASRNEVETARTPPTF